MKGDRIAFPYPMVSKSFSYLIPLVVLLCLFSLTTKAQIDFEYYSKVLERMVELQNDSMHRLEKDLSNTKVVMLKENLEKKVWVKIFVGETVLIGATVLAFITGAWVPILMCTAMIETYLLIEGTYRLNIRKLKDIRKIDKKLSDYVK